MFKMNYKGFLKITFGLLTLVIAGGVLLQSDEKSPEELHKFHLENSPYKETQKLSKK